MNQYGLYTLAELRDIVRRKCDTYRANVNITTGAETSLQQLDPIVSNEDIDMYLNTALIKRMIDINVLDNTIMADEQKINIVANTVEYALPEDLFYIRALYFKPLGVTYSEVPPSMRIYLQEYDQDNDQNWLFDGTPTYRRRLNTIVLNQVPTQANPGGLVVDYVKSHLALRADDQVIETPLAQIIQEVVILDAVVFITTEKMQVTAQEIRQSLSDMEQRLMLAATNYHAPKVVSFVNTGVRLANSPTNRRPSWGGIYGRFW